jgi:hypothetical protein
MCYPNQGVLSSWKMFSLAAALMTVLIIVSFVFFMAIFIALISF